MKELFKRASIFTRIEFWAFITLFVFTLFFFIVHAFSGDVEPYKSVEYYPFFSEARMPFDFYRNYFFPRLINLLFQFFIIWCLNFVLVPALFNKKSRVRNLLWVALLFVSAGILFGTTNTYLKEYMYTVGTDSYTVDQQMFHDGLINAISLFWGLIVYIAVRSAGLYLFARSESIRLRYQFLRREAIAAFIIWFIALVLIRLAYGAGEFLVGWIVVVPSAILLYIAAFHILIPRSLAHARYQFVFYLLKNIGILVIAFFVNFFVLAAVLGGANDAIGYSFFNFLFQLLITVPVTWALYKRQLKGDEKIQVLQKELQQSSASFDFLRSQINPHFLFNALNTIYGTAIQEKAERTSDGIEKLGDMMRFMLVENMQDKISLSREIDYLNNYIALQKLRTNPDPNIRIDVQIEEQLHTIQIAPMLLIPFVENAFKHGISFREPSYIKISLSFRNNTLYFEVANSQHVKPGNDPEKNRSGIGLNNVRQRLQLLYKDRHELFIRENSKEFFVELALQLA